MSTGLLVLRLLLAGLLFGHAVQKLFGWFGGSGLAATATVFASWGFRPGVPMVLMAGTCELVAAGLLALGLVVPLAAAIAIGTMTVAVSANFAKGFWAHLGGYEVAFVYAGMAFVVALTGPGRFSVDRAAGLDRHGVGWGFLALAAGLLAAAPPVLARRRNLAADRSSGQPD
ncbi:MAG TPA: DoxX family protein [Mycobacteriales bacterium]|nr:DoxX family protein [Mycobacteriales bacterium]